MGKIKFSKKMMYSTLAAIGLMGSTGAIVGSVVTNNQQTSQMISQINSEIDDTSNSMNVNSNDNPYNQSPTVGDNNTPNIADADAYSSLINLSNFKNVDYTTTFSKYNTGSKTTDTQTDTIDPTIPDGVSDSEATTGINGDLTINSVLNTKKDAIEIANELNPNNVSQSNLYKSLQNAMLTYKYDWYNNLSSKIENLENTYNNNFYVTSITPINQHGSFAQDVEGIGVNSINQTIKESQTTNNDPNNDSEPNFTWETQSQIIDGGNIVSQPNIIGTDLATDGFYFYYSGEGAGSTETQMYDNFTPRIWGKNDPEPMQDLSGDVYFQNQTSSSQTQSGWVLSSVELDVYEGAGIGDNDGGAAVHSYGTSNNNPYNYGPSSSEASSAAAGSSSSYNIGNEYLPIDPNTMQEESETWNNPNSQTTPGNTTGYVNGLNNIVLVNPIIDDTYNFNSLVNNSINPNSSISFNTFLNTSKQNDDNVNTWSIAERYVPKDWDWSYHSFVFNRALLNWTLERTPTYGFDTNTYSLQINTGDGNGLVDLVNSDGSINTNSNAYKGLFIDDSSLKNKNYYWIDGNSLGNEKINGDFASYYQDRANAEQDILDLYKNSQLDNIMQNINATSRTFNVSDFNKTQITQNNAIFGNGTPFTITKTVLQPTYNTNYDDFNVSQDAFGDQGVLLSGVDENGNAISGLNTSYLFNNFLPVLANQIVVDPTSVVPYESDSAQDGGVYPTPSNGDDYGIKFKLSENMSRLLSIANLYDEYYDQVNTINPSSYSGTLSGLLTSFKNLFGNFAFTQTNEPTISDILLQLNSGKYNASDLADEINFLINNTSCNFTQKDFENGKIPSTTTPTTTYNDNENEVKTLINTIFNTTTNTYCPDGTTLSNDAKNILVLLPTAVKNAMSNNITATINYGNGDVKNQIIWDSTKNQFNKISINPPESQNNSTLLANNEMQIDVSNVQFVDKNASTNDALIDNTSFVNNGINTNLGYMTNELKQYYPDENSISVDSSNNGLIYKFKYNPDFMDWTPMNNYLTNQGIPINNVAYKASDYMGDTSNYLSDDVEKQKLTDIGTAVSSFFATKANQPEINVDSSGKDVVPIDQNYVSNSNNAYATQIQNIANVNGLGNLDPNDSDGTFYSLVTIENSQNFANPEGDSNGVVVPNIMWYLGTNTSNPTKKTYLVKMNATVKDYNLCNLSFVGNSKTGVVNWSIVDNSNYYDNDTSNQTFTLATTAGKPNETQSFTISSTQYINLTYDNDSTYLENQLDKMFNDDFSNYNISINTINVVVNSDHSYTINLTLNVN